MRGSTIEWAGHGDVDAAGFDRVDEMADAVVQSAHDWLLGSPDGSLIARMRDRGVLYVATFGIGHGSGRPRIRTR